MHITPTDGLLTTKPLFLHLSVRLSVRLPTYLSRLILPKVPLFICVYPRVLESLIDVFK